MKKLLFLLIGSFFTSLVSLADNWPAGAASAGTADASVMVADLWSSYHNQAGLGRLTGLAAGMHFGNAYFIKELGLKSIAFAMPSKFGTFGLNYSYFGYAGYNESKAGFAYAKSLGSKISVGMQLDYFSVRLDDEYGKRGIVTAELGLLAEPIENFFVGVHVFNPVKAQVANYQDERLPAIFRLGIGYKFYKKLLLSVETQKNNEMPEVFKAGINYELFSGLFLRTGISTNPTLSFFGLGYNFKNIQFDFAFSHHQVLGYTSFASISYLLK